MRRVNECLLVPSEFRDFAEAGGHWEAGFIPPDTRVLARSLSMAQTRQLLLVYYLPLPLFAQLNSISQVRLDSRIPVL